jgi:hypothetical protein
MLIIQCICMSRTFLAINCDYLPVQKDERAKPGSRPNSSALSEVGEHRIEKYFHDLVFGGLIGC